MENNIAASEVAHEKFLEFIEDENFKKQMKEVTSETRKKVEDKLSAVIEIVDAKNKQFLDWVIEQSKSNFYLFEKDNQFGLMKRNFKGMLVIGFKIPRKDIEHFFEGHSSLIEIVNIHSAQKGQGYKMMKEVIKLSDKTKMPIYLWTELDKNVEYFKRYGFENLGRVGANNEFLMILKRNDY